MAKKAKAKKKTTGTKARPSIGPLRKQMKGIQGNLASIISAGKDKKGKLTKVQLKKAKKTKKALDSALKSIVPCIQFHSPY
jgi:hypothetical protein